MKMLRSHCIQLITKYHWDLLQEFYFDNVLSSTALTLHIKEDVGVGGEEGGYGAWKQKYTYLCISTYPEWLTNCWSSLWLFLIALNNLCHVLSTYYWNNFYFFLYLKKQTIFTIVSEFQTLLQTTSEIRGSKQMSGHKLFEKISNQQLTRNKR